MPSPAAVSDTHALVWYASGQHRKLGRDARRYFKRADEGKAVIHIPALVLIELLELITRGHLKAHGTADEWVESLFSGARYQHADLTRDIALAAHHLQGIPERGDRLIAATAAHLELPLITRDGAIGRSAGVSVIW